MIIDHRVTGVKVQRRLDTCYSLHDEPVRDSWFQASDGRAAAVYWYCLLSRNLLMATLFHLYSIAHEQAHTGFG